METLTSMETDSTPPFVHPSIISRTTTIERSYCKRRVHEEREAQDTLIRIQQRRISELEEKVRELRTQLYAADSVNALTFDIFHLSLDSDSGL